MFPVILIDACQQLLADAHIKIAAVHAGLSRVKECYEEFDKALNEKPDHVDVYMQRARVSGRVPWVWFQIPPVPGCYGIGRS